MPSRNRSPVDVINSSLQLLGIDELCDISSLSLADLESSTSPVLKTTMNSIKKCGKRQIEESTTQKEKDSACLSLTCADYVYSLFADKAKLKRDLPNLLNLSIVASRLKELRDAKSAEFSDNDNDASLMGFMGVVDRVRGK